MLPGAKPGGPPRRASSRDPVNAILSKRRGGQAWRLLPHGFPPWQTLCHDVLPWQAEGAWERIHLAVPVADLQRAGRGERLLKAMLRQGDPTAGGPVPYFAQWESPELIAEFLGGRDAATDPAWPGSGATDAAEYARWADHLCGMACLRMALAARGEAHCIHELRRAVQPLGGYIEEPDGNIRGLIYIGAVRWLNARGIAARIVLDEPMPRLRPGEFYIASVHPMIRRPEATPPRKGGHLVLVFGTDEQGRLRFHNPSGTTPAEQRDVRMTPEAFSRFHADRGILIPL